MKTRGVIAVNQVDKARAAGHEVMIDLPMEPPDYTALDPGPGRQALEHRPDVGGLERGTPKCAEERLSATQADDHATVGCPLLNEGESFRVEAD
ncbi:MAG: divergent polysaccharide deacetylase family protein, partial [Proteobacteria bacterium]|nr:divergent polysaccharide deacetylase family protein [Pseudomonadota bacterium]